MMIKGTCQKRELPQKIHDAIIGDGSNWQEMSSNKVQDFKWTGDQSDGWVFKSPPIGTKGESVILQMKHIDFNITATNGHEGNGGNHFYFWLADNYEPSITPNTSGTFTSKGMFHSWIFTHIDAVNCGPLAKYDYIVDVLDHRIMIVIQRHNETITTYPQFIYIGYPEPNTNLEGKDYTNQFIVGSNINNGSSTVAYVSWHKASNGKHNGYAYTSCTLNAANPNPMGLYLLSPILVTGDGGTGMPNTGPLGVLSGLYGLPPSGIVNNDTIMIGSDEYKVFAISQWSINTSASSYGGHSENYVNYMNGITPTMIAIKIN